MAGARDDEVLLKTRLDNSGLKKGAEEGKRVLDDELGKGGKAAAEGVGAVTKEGEKLGEQFRGTEPVISGVNAALSTFGSQGSSSVLSVGSAVASLVTGGLGPLAIALSAITVGLSLALEENEKAASAFERTEEAVDGTRKSIERLRVELELLRSGSAAEDLDIEIRGAELQLRRLENRARLERLSPDIGAQGASSYWRNLGSTFFPTDGFLPGIRSATEQAEHLVDLHRQYLDDLRRERDLAEEAAEERERAAEAADREAEETKRTADELDRLLAQRRSFGARTEAARDELDQLQGRTSESAAVLAQRRRIRDAGRALGELYQGGRDPTDVEVQRARERVDAEVEYLKLLKEIEAEKEKQDRAAAIRRWAEREGDRQDKNRLREQREEEKLAAEERQRVERDLEERSASSERNRIAFERSQLEAERAARQADYERRLEEHELSESRFEAAESIGERSADSLVSALQGRIRDGNFDGFFEEFGSRVADTVTEAFLHATIAEPLRASFGSLSGGIFGLFNNRTTEPEAPIDPVFDAGGGAPADAGGGGTVAKYNLVADFSGQADEIARKMSADGSKSIVVRAQESNGIPRRRPR